MKKSMLFLSVIIIYSVACSQGSIDEKKSITASELKQQLSNDDLIVLDVRTDAEVIGPMKMIDHAVHIPIDQLESRIGELDKYKNKKIAVICRSGKRSAKGTKILQQHGFDAVNVEGGMLAYTGTK